MSHFRVVSSLTAFILFALFSTPIAFAQTDAAVEIEASTAVDTMPVPVPTNVQPPPPAPGSLPQKKPFDAMREKAQQIKQNAQGAKVELRTDTKLKMQNASSSGEKREVMKGAWEEHKDIAKERIASTTQLKRDIKSLVRMHGGQIKNRFNLAINHMKKLLARVDTRLGKMVEAGIDTSSVGALKASADAAIAKAEADALAVGTFVSGVSDTSDRAIVKTELQAKIKTAQESVRAAHVAVKSTVRALVDLSKANKKVGADVSVENTTTVETSTE